VIVGGRRPPPPIGWGSLSGRSNLWRSLSRDGPEAWLPRRASKSSARLSSCWRTRQTRPGSARRGVSTTPSPEPERLPSDRPRCRHRSGSIQRLLLHVRGLDPAPFRLPRSAPRSVKSVVVASGYSFPHGSPRDAPPGGGEDASPRSLQPTYDTSTLRIDRFSAARGLEPRGPRPNAVHGGRSHREHPE
jgi:hypothetical protein